MASGAGPDGFHVVADPPELRAVQSVLVYDAEAEGVVQAIRSDGNGGFFVTAPRSWLDHWAGFLAGESNHSRDSEERRLLESVLDKVEAVLRR